MRIIREHRVYGREIEVSSVTEEAATAAVQSQTKDHIWEIGSPYIGRWIAYVARDEDVFALND